MPDAVEPPSPQAAALLPEHARLVDAVITELGHLPGALLPLLHAIQDRLGFVPPAAVPRLADALNLSRAEVHGVLSFYHDFRTSPPGRHVLRLCRAEACQAVGCDALADHVRSRLGIDFNQTTSDGDFTLEAIYCLGNCAAGPSVQLDGHLRARATPDRVDAWIAARRSSASITPSGSPSTT